MWSWKDHPLPSYEAFTARTLRYTVTLMTDLLNLNGCREFFVTSSNVPPTSSVLRRSILELSCSQTSINTDSQSCVNLWKIYVNLENHREYPDKPYTARIWSLWATSSSLIVWAYLRSHFCGGLRKTHAFCNTVHNDPSRSPNVVDFGTNR